MTTDRRQFHIDEAERLAGMIEAASSPSEGGAIASWAQAHAALALCYPVGPISAVAWSEYVIVSQHPIIGPPGRTYAVLSRTNEDLVYDDDLTLADAVAYRDRLIRAHDQKD